MTRLRRVLLAAAAAIGGILVSLGSATAAYAYGPYHVANTGGSSLNIRSAPSLGASVIGSLPAGATIDIACQTTGSEVNGVSNIWDHLTSGGYVSDYYTDTPGVGVYSPPIPQCSPPAPTPPPSSPPAPVTTAPPPPPSLPGRVHARVMLNLIMRGRLANLLSVRILRLPAHGEVIVRCHGRGCRDGRVVIHPSHARRGRVLQHVARLHARRISDRLLHGRELHVGDRLVFTLTASGFTPERLEFVIHRNRVVWHYV